MDLFPQGKVLVSKTAVSEACKILTYFLGGKIHILKNCNLAPAALPLRGQSFNIKAQSFNIKVQSFNIKVQSFTVKVQSSN